MDLEKLSKIYADSFRRLSEANRRPTVQEALENLRVNTAAMRNNIGNNTKEGDNMKDSQEIDALRDKLKLQQELLYCRKKEILDMCVTAKDQNRVSLDEVADILGVKRLTKQDKYNIVKSRNFRVKMNDNQEIKIGLTCADDEPSKLVIDAKDAIKVDLGAGNKWDGEGLPPVGTDCEFKPYNTWESGVYRGKNKLGDLIFEFADSGVVDLFDESTKIRKPETPQQREERERLEAAYDLYVIAQLAIDGDVIDYSDFVKNSRQMRGALAIIDKTGYRLEVKPTKE